MAGAGISQAGKGRGSGGSHAARGSRGTCEAANTFSRDHPMDCNPHGPLVGEVMLWQVGCPSPLPSPTVLSYPLVCL